MLQLGVGVVLWWELTHPSLEECPAPAHRAWGGALSQHKPHWPHITAGVGL